VNEHKKIEVPIPAVTKTLFLTAEKKEQFNFSGIELTKKFVKNQLVVS